jgi:hypothetical protein
MGKKMGKKGEPGESVTVLPASADGPLNRTTVVMTITANRRTTPSPAFGLTGPR